MHGFSICLYSAKGLRVRFFPLREGALRLLYSSRWAKMAQACGYTEWELRYE